MAKLRRCQCEREFLKGKKCLVETQDGRLVRKLVCFTCANKAERIVLRRGTEPCEIPGCTRLARICGGCMAEALMKERTERMASVVKQLRGTIAAMRLTAPRPGEVDAAYEYALGKREGLESALSTVLQGCHPSATKG